MSCYLLATFRTIKLASPTTSSNVRTINSVFLPIKKRPIAVKNPGAWHENIIDANFNSVMLLSVIMWEAITIIIINIALASEPTAATSYTSEQFDIEQ